MADGMNKWLRAYKTDNQRVWDGYNRLKDLDLVVLDNSVRESTVGQLKSHTSEDKFKIFDEAQKCGFQVGRFFCSRGHGTLYVAVLVHALVRLSVTSSESFYSSFNS